MVLASIYLLSYIIFVIFSRAVSRLPPKRVVVGGGSVRFLQRRRAALQRWLTLVARHPLLAHDADMRAFLCELAFRPERPRHDEFTLAGAKPNSVCYFINIVVFKVKDWLTAAAAGCLVVVVLCRRSKVLCI